jgi:TRAP-type C4-dicarboxylate transport system permease small subunit
MASVAPEPLADIGPIDPVSTPEPQSLPARIVFVTGSVALLIAMSSDAIAVAGRHIGIPLLGSIEIVQAAASVAGASAIVGATLVGAHASIHILTDRVSFPAKRMLSIAANALAFLFFAIVAFGCGWVAWDLHAGQEQSELLALPILPLRLFVTAAFGATAMIFLVRLTAAVRGRR